MGRVNDVIASLFLVLVGVAVIIEANKLTIGTIKNPGAGFFPFLGGCCLIVLCLILLVQALRGRSLGVKAFGDLLRPALLVIGFVVYTLIFDLAGYVISTIILSAVVLRILDTKSWWVVAGVSIFIAVGTYILFDRFLQTPLPAGILQRIW